MYTARLPNCIELPCVIELSPSSLSTSSVSSQRNILNYKMKSQKQPIQEGGIERNILNYKMNSQKQPLQKEGEKSKKLSLKECE
jgi:hypothetical protein